MPRCIFCSAVFTFFLQGSALGGRPPSQMSRGPDLARRVACRSFSSGHALACAVFLGCSLSAAAFVPPAGSGTPRGMRLRPMLRPALGPARHPRCNRAHLGAARARVASVLMAAGDADVVAAAAAGPGTILCAAAGKAQAIDAGLQVLVSKVLGYGILVGSLFLQVPQLFKILKLRSVKGISRWSRYSEVPINTSSCIYHYLIQAPLSTWGENIIVLAQNLIIVSLCWLWDKQRVVSESDGKRALPVLFHPSKKGAQHLTLSIPLARQRERCFLLSRLSRPSALRSSRCRRTSCRCSSGSTSPSYSALPSRKSCKIFSRGTPGSLQSRPAS